MPWDKKTRPQKDDVRSYALEGLARKRKTLWMPAAECYCIQRAFDLRIIDLNTKVVCVERDQGVMTQLARSIRQWRWQNQPMLFLGELAHLPLPYSLDFAFLDFTGAFEEATVWWMANHLAKKLSAGADLCVTHAYGWRNNVFMYDFARRFKEKFRPQYDELKREVWIGEDQIVFPMAMLKCIFPSMRYTIRWPVKYRDSVQSMLLYRMENFQPTSNDAANGWPALADVLPSKEEPMKKSKSAVAKKATPAKKAWETRRRQQAQVSATEVIDALVSGSRNRNRLFDRYVERKVAEGYKEERVRAAIKAHVTRQTA